MALPLPDDAFRWLETVTADDLILHGLLSQTGETPAQTVQRLADELDVDLAGVGACLELLRSGHCMLCGGAPMAMLAFSARRGVYRACFDGECAEELSALSTASAGVWLLLAATELGELPRSDKHWLIAKLTDGGVEAINGYVRDLAENYARQMRDAPNGGLPPLDVYEALIGRAFWCCASHCLR